METRYVNCPWVQLQIHPNTYNALKMCGVATGQGPTKYLESLIRSSILSTLSDIYDSDEDAHRVMPSVQLVVGSHFPPDRPAELKDISHLNIHK